jgi:hypothetical protein
MILKNLDNIDLDNFPVAIFGSGPAGITTALELEKKNIKCLLIEAGGENYNKTSQEFYKGKIIGDQITDLSLSRLRQLGGTSGHWGGWSKPMEKYNLELWPINENNLNPYLKRTCEILNINNQFRKSSLNEFFNQIEFQYSKVRFADKFKNYIKNSNNILLILNTQLSYFVGQYNNTEYAVCISNDIVKKIRTKYFILACGGIENSRLLLWTRDKNQKFIDNDLPIGKYWMTHPGGIGGKGIISRKKLKEKMKNNFLEHDKLLRFAAKRELIIKKKILSAAIYMNAKEDTKIYKEVIKDILCVAPEYGKKIARMIFKRDLKCGNIFMLLEENPTESNKIVLDKKKDKFGIPMTKLFYKKSKYSLKTAKLFMEEFGNLCRKEDLGRIAIKESIYNLEELEPLGAYHHLGGTRMGIDKSDSVVNKDLKVHGINNLYVSGSSNFVTGGYTNPTFTIIQLAIRLAEKISERLNAV